MGFKTYCSTGEFWGAKFINCEKEFDPEPGEVYDFIENKIKNYELDSIPDSIIIETTNYLDEDCFNYEEAEFEINPFDYLNKEEIKDLEKLIDEVWDEGE